MDGSRDIESIASDEQTLPPRHVRRALAHLRDNLSDKVTLSELASICAVPERTLLKQFQKFIGLPPLTYLRRLRLNAAKSRLAEVGCKGSIADIAMGLGTLRLRQPRLRSPGPRHCRLLAVIGTEGPGLATKQFLHWGSGRVSCGWSTAGSDALESQSARGEPRRSMAVPGARPYRSCHG